MLEGMGWGERRLCLWLLRREDELGPSPVPAAPGAAPRGGRRRRPWTAPALNAVGALQPLPGRAPGRAHRNAGRQGRGTAEGEKKEKEKKRDDESDFPSESLSVHVLKAWNQFSVAAPRAGAAKAAPEG